MNILSALFKWISESLLSPFTDTNITNEQQGKQQKNPEIYTKRIKGELISTYPDYNEIIHLETPHLGLGNYALFYTLDIVMIKIELQRLSESYVLVKIADREVLWDIRDDVIYTEEYQDSRYWSKNIYLTVKRPEEFIMRPEEILGFIE